MSTTLNEEADDDDFTSQTDVRFGMRGLFVAMTLVAIVAAIVGTGLRGASDDGRKWVGGLCGVCGVVVLGAVVKNARKRFRLERQAGARLLNLVPSGSLSTESRAWGVYGDALVRILLAAGLLCAVGLAARNERPDDLDIAWFLGATFGSISTYLFIDGIIRIWWTTHIQLHENGLLRGLQFLPWSHVTGQYWFRETIVFEGVDLLHKDVRLKAILPQADAGRVSVLVKQRLAKEVFTPADAALDPRAFYMHPTLVQIETTEAMVWRRLVTCVVVFYLGSTMLVGGVVMGPHREMGIGVGLGFILMLGTVLFNFTRVARAGTPLIRLQARLDFLSSIAVVALGGACLAINWLLVFPGMWVTIPIGIAYGALAVCLLELILRERIDLCEHGVVAVRAWFIPWDGIRVVRWNRETNGRLLLQRGWMRIATRVPPLQRDAVNRLLNDKVWLDSSVLSPAKEDTGVESA